MPLTIFVGKTNEIPAEPGARANARDCHAPCFRTCRASPRRGSSIAFGKSEMILAFIMRYSEARKHWWFIDPDDLDRAFLVCAGMCLFVLLWAVVTRGKGKPLKLPITLWIGCGLAVLLIALSMVMSAVQGPSPMGL